MSPNKPAYLLDSFALLSYLNAEPGGQRVQEVLALAEQSHCRAIMCLINLGEVLYITERRRGLAKAQAALALVESLPLQLLDATRDLILDAAHVKAKYPLSYADAFVAALATREHAVILTGDPEFEAVQQVLTIEWLAQTQD